MARKIKLTRPELKRQREALARFERYLPMLKLKQQQLQLTLREVQEKVRRSQDALEQARRAFARYENVLADLAGVDVRGAATPKDVLTSSINVAGVALPVFERAVFPQVAYSLFGTPPWVDRAVEDLREISRRQAETDVLRRQHERVRQELTKITQRVNLFEKVMIPACREAIRMIRIRLGDEMTAAVGRAKIAKAKLVETTAAGGTTDFGEPHTPAPEGAVP